MHFTMYICTYKSQDRLGTTFTVLIFHLSIILDSMSGQPPFLKYFPTSALHPNKTNPCSEAANGFHGPILVLRRNSFYLMFL